MSKNWQKAIGMTALPYEKLFVSAIESKGQPKGRYSLFFIPLKSKHKEKNML
jgi:hypothetical protein